jgi:hypothetical protein
VLVSDRFAVYRYANLTLCVFNGVVGSCFYYIVFNTFLLVAYGGISEPFGIRQSVISCLRSNGARHVYFK